MSRLQEQYGDRVDFFILDIDKPETKPVRDQFGLVRRTQYVLIDADGNILMSWAGPLNQEMVMADIGRILAGL